MESNVVYPLATSTWGEEEYGAIDRVVRSGQFTMGREVQLFEARCASAFGSKHAVMVNSGSSANLLMIGAAVLEDRLDLQPGDEVIVPAVSWSTTYFPLVQYGLVPRLVDIDAHTLNMDVRQVADAVSSRTRAVLAVSLLGNPADFAALRGIAEANSLILLEDNCESLGGRLDGKFTGTFGLMGSLSTFFSHHISTMEGGVILTDDQRLADTLRSLRAHGWTRDLSAESHLRPEVDDEFGSAFRFVLPGYNVRPLELSGAIGYEQIGRIPSIVAGRRANARHFQEVVSHIQDVRIQTETGESSWFGFSLVLQGRLAGKRRGVVEALKRAGIESRPIVAGNFARNPVMTRISVEVHGSLPVADEIHTDGLFVGNHHYPVIREIDLLAEVLQSV